MVCGLFAGHIEIQGQTLYASVGRIAAMYADLSYDISTSDEFAEEIKKLLQKVAASLEIEEEVRLNKITSLGSNALSLLLSFPQCIRLFLSSFS